MFTDENSTTRKAFDGRLVLVLVLVLVLILLLNTIIEIINVNNDIKNSNNNNNNNNNNTNTMVSIYYLGSRRLIESRIDPIEFMYMMATL